MIKAIALLIEKAENGFTMKKDDKLYVFPEKGDLLTFLDTELDCLGNSQKLKKKKFPPFFDETGDEEY